MKPVMGLQMGPNGRCKDIVSSRMGKLILSYVNSHQSCLIIAIETVI